MTDKKTGGPAFPVPGFEYLDDRGEEDERVVYQPFRGMSMRDYLAAKAMQALIANPNNSGTYGFISKHAYEMADAMLEARND